MVTNKALNTFVFMISTATFFEIAPQVLISHQYTSTESSYGKAAGPNFIANECETQAGELRYLPKTPSHPSYYCKFFHDAQSFQLSSNTLCVLWRRMVK